MTLRQRRGIAVLGLVLAILNAFAVPGALPGGLQLAAVLGFGCLGPGAAVIAHMRIRDVSVAWAMILLISLCVTAGTATLLIWSAWWHPEPISLVITGLVALSCAMALLPIRGWPSEDWDLKSWLQTGRITVQHRPTGVGMP